MKYLESLQVVKTTFIGGKDKAVVAHAISQRVAKRHLSILDVGVGDGSYLGKMTRLLIAEGFRLSVVGIDPISTHFADAQSALPGATLVASTLEDYPIGTRYDIVLSRQSLYYSDDWRNAVDRLASLTASGGWLIINLWSDSCVLCKLHDSLVHNSGRRALTAETVFDTVRHHPSLTDVAIEYCRGSVDLSLWLADHEVLCAGYEVVSRQPLATCQSSDKAMKLERLIKHCPQPWVRANGIIFAKVR